MAFELLNLLPCGGQSRPRKSTPAGSATAAGVAQWSYFSATDNLAAIKAAGYFNEARNLLSPGDSIQVSENGAAGSFIFVNAVPQTGNVTIHSADINSA